MIFLVSGAEKIGFPYEKKKKDINFDLISHHYQFQVNYKSKWEKPSIQLLEDNIFLIKHRKSFLVVWGKI